MATVFTDRVLETTTTSGTGSLSLDGAVTGYQRFSTVGNGNTAYYSIWAIDTNGTPSGDWEVGLGTWATGHTLARTTVLASSNSGSAVSFASGTTKRVALVYPASVAIYSGGPLGTPSSGTLTSCTGLPISTGVSGLGTGVATFLGTPSSANLLAAVTNETGTGALVFADTPTLIAPLLGIPTSGTLTNCTLPVGGLTGLGTGVATFLATPTSANLAASITDETGTGLLVLATNPVLTTPNCGTPSAIVLTNGTGLVPATGLSSVTGTGAAMLAASPTTTGTLTGAAANFSGAVSTAALTATSGTFTGQQIITLTTSQRLTRYDGSNLLTETISSSGGYTQALTGTNSGFTWTPSGSGGATLTTGALTLSSGNLVLTSGNATLTSGNLTLTSGSISVTSGSTTSIASANNKVVENKLLYGATTDAATAVELTTDGAAGSGATNRIAVPANVALSIVLNICVKQSASASAKQMLRQVVISNNGGTTAIQGSVIALGTDSGTAGLATVTCTITANDTDDCLKVEVNGVISTNLRYTCYVVSAEVLYA